MREAGQNSDDRAKGWLQRFAFVALFALSVVVFMGKSSENSLQALDSTTHAVLAMNATGDGLKPRLPIPDFQTNQKTNPVFNDHPFPLFYLSGLVMRHFGPSAWSARLVATGFSVACVMLVAMFGAAMYSVPVGLFAGLVLLTSRDFVLIGSRFHLDTPMTFFILLSFYFWYRKRPIWTGVAAGLGLWMKSPVAFLVFPSAFLSLLLTRQLSKKEFLNLCLAGLVAIAVGAGVWIITGVVGGWEWVADYWTRQVWGTAVNGRGSPQRNYGFGIELLQRNYLPWFYLLAASLLVILVSKRWKKTVVALPLCGALILEAVVSMLRFRFYWYFIPVFPLLALLVADLFEGWLGRRWFGMSVFLILAGLIVPAFLVATPLDFGPENFPALRRFDAIIQSYGSCSDHVQFVEGGQPYGDTADYNYEIAFYSGRKILESHCEDAAATAGQYRPEWIVITGKNLENCLPEKLRSEYPVRYQFGRQYLLSKIVPPAQANDLTPLARELKPPVPSSCAPAPFPDDGYFPNARSK